jgi:hypothetical protein
VHPRLRTSSTGRPSIRNLPFNPEASDDARVAVRSFAQGLGVSLDGFISGPNDGADAPMGHGGEESLTLEGLRTDLQVSAA